MADRTLTLGDIEYYIWFGDIDKPVEQTDDTGHN